MGTVGLVCRDEGGTRTHASKQALTWGMESRGEKCRRADMWAYVQQRGCSRVGRPRMNVISSGSDPEKELAIPRIRIGSTVTPRSRTTGIPHVARIVRRRVMRKQTWCTMCGGQSDRPCSGRYEPHIGLQSREERINKESTNFRETRCILLLMHDGCTLWLLHRVHRARERLLHYATS